VHFEPWVTILVAFALSAVLTGLVRRFALSRGMLDEPNARSSHSRATPRGGGLAIAVVVLIAVIVLACVHRIAQGLLLSILVGGIAVAAIGFMDDRRPMSARVRLAVHVGAAIWAVAWIGVPLALRSADPTSPLNWVGAVGAVLALGWTLNLFNFMDGIDGIAASEAVFVACAGAILGHGGLDATAVVALVFAAACAGFLAWNWPPARIFMGDVGSGFLGYVIGVLALTAGCLNRAALWVWLILGGAFFADASVTLVVRLLRGARASEAHRSHAYQHLARRWGSHKRVTLAVTAVNLSWLFPCAWLAAANPALSGWICLAAMLPLALVTFLVGAGRPESPPKGAGAGNSAAVP
jgi:Fuc2NAc and GlcNAc transferase